MVSAFQAIMWVGFAAALMVPSFATWSHERIVDMRTNCNAMIHMKSPSMRLRMSNRKHVTECRIHFYADEDYRLMARFRGVSHYHRRDKCITDWLKIYDGNRTTDPIIDADANCNLKTPYECSENFITIQFRKPTGLKHKIGWEMIISTFRTTTDDDNTCTQKEFRCDENRCIDKRLRCDRNCNCMDRKDEEGCHRHVSIGAICGIAIAAMIAVAACASICAFLMRKRRNGEDVEVVTDTEAGPLPEKKLPPIDNTAWAMPPAYDAWVPGSTSADPTWQAAPTVQPPWQPATPPPEYKAQEGEPVNEATETSGANPEPGTSAGRENKGHEAEK